LPSFPTRRSSDLVEDADAAVLAVEGELPVGGVVAVVGVGDGGLVAGRPERDPLVAGPGAVALLPPPVVDGAVAGVVGLVDLEVGLAVGRVEEVAALLALRPAPALRDGDGVAGAVAVHPEPGGQPAAGGGGHSGGGLGEGRGRHGRGGSRRRRRRPLLAGRLLPAP